MKAFLEGRNDQFVVTGYVVAKVAYLVQKFAGGAEIQCMESTTGLLRVVEPVGELDSGKNLYAHKLLHNPLSTADKSWPAHRRVRPEPGSACGLSVNSIVVSRCLHSASLLQLGISLSVLVVPHKAGL